MEESKTQSRKMSLDILRILATCAVVLLHTVSGIKDTTDMNQYPEQFRVFLAVLDMVTWSVPVFIMISGFLFLAPDRSYTFGQMIGKYCRRILLALFLFGVPFAIIELVIGENTIDLGMLGRAVLMVLQGKSWSHMWYLYLIFFLYLFTPIIRWILQRLPRIGLYALMAVLVIGSSLLVYVNKYVDRGLFPVLPDVCIYVFYYLYGYLMVLKSKEDMKKSRIPNWVLLLCSGLLLLGMVCNRMLTAHQVQMAYEYPGTVACALLLFAWAVNREWKLSEKCQSRLQQLSGLCFAIYLIHPVYLNVAYKFLHLTLLDYPLWMSIPAFWLIIMLLSVGTAWVLRKITLLRRYVL